ncbi:MAG: hypothetical protein ACFB10_10800 [Salibacteraceae bacterium]
MLAIEPNDPSLRLFQTIVNQNEITAGIGVPTKSQRGTHISLLVFQPHAERKVYSKQLLPTDELPFFVKGGSN